MADSPLNTPYDNAVAPYPTGAFGTPGNAADPGGPGPGGNPLTTPYDNGLASAPAGPETPNSESGLPKLFEYFNVGESAPTNPPDVSSGQIPLTTFGQK